MKGTILSIKQNRKGENQLSKEKKRPLLPTNQAKAKLKEKFKVLKVRRHEHLLIKEKDKEDAKRKVLKEADFTNEEKWFSKA